MAGTAFARELSTRFAIARAADDRAIRRLLRENPMRGTITVTFEREPDYFRGTNLAGGEDQTIVAFADDRLVCMGRCTRRNCWVNGVARPVGYLGELRLDSSVRGRFAILRDGYRFFRNLQRDRPADLYFTSIAADNARARRLLEKGAPGLPSYDFMAELQTLLIPVPRRVRTLRLQVEEATPERLPDLVRLLNTARPQLATVWTADLLRDLAAHALPLNRFLLALDGREVIACGALWDQRSFRQTVIRGYSPALARARMWVNLASRILGTARMPAVGSPLAHAFLSPLAFAQGAEGLLPDFISVFFPAAKRIGAEFLTLTLPASDPRLRSLQRQFSPRTWRSRLYRVDWPDHPAVSLGEGEALYPDVALL